MSAGWQKEKKYCVHTHSHYMKLFRLNNNNNNIIIKSLGHGSSVANYRVYTNISGIMLNFCRIFILNYYYDADERPLLVVTRLANKYRHGGHKMVAKYVLLFIVLFR